jgi:predicted transcriptional regulator of viral defense system
MGVVAARQLVALGYSRNAIAYANASGRLRHLHRGVYAIGHTPVTWHSRCLAAVLSCGPNAVASHRSAAWIWGLIRYQRGAFDVTVPVRRRHRRSDLRLHYAGPASSGASSSS